MNHGNLIKLLGLVVLAAISVMAVNSSAAQAKYLLLLNKASVAGVNFALTVVGTSKTVAENGLEVKCTGGSGTAKATLSAGKEKVTGEAAGTLTGCEWVGNKFCTINDGGKGLVKLKGAGELIMEGTNYILTATSAEFLTIKSEGELCSLPAKEVISGTAHVLINNALADTTAKTGQLLTLTLKLGNSKVKETNAVVEAKDENAAATIGLHLVELTGCTPIC